MRGFLIPSADADGTDREFIPHSDKLISLNHVDGVVPREKVYRSIAIERCIRLLQHQHKPIVGHPFKDPPLAEEPHAIARKQNANRD